ncbi:HoxN/HupN/NixA family nickel/cobalt transporter, partial [Amycolatopsis sp. NPDC023774]
MAVSAPSTSGRQPLSRREWGSLSGMAAVILLLNLVGWGVLVLFIAPHHYDLGASGVFGIGLGVTAFTLGMRHA